MKQIGLEGSCTIQILDGLTGCPLGQDCSEPEPSVLDDELFTAINTLRADPTAFVTNLDTYISGFSDMTVTVDGVEYVTTEGTVPV